jgi:hypothetical protein
MSLEWMGEIELRVSFCTFTISSIQDDSVMTLKEESGGLVR